MRQSPVRFVYGFHTHAVVPDLPCSHQVVEDTEHFNGVVHGRMRTMQLEQIDRVHLEVSQTLVYPRGQVGA